MKDVVTLLSLLLLMLHLGACADRSAVQGEITSGNTDAIVGGETAEASDLRTETTVLILTKSDTGQEGICAGTMIQPDIVLTAAHCISNPESMQVVFGLAPIKQAADKIIRVKNYIIHGNFNRDGEVRNDIALLQIQERSPHSSVANVPWTKTKTITPLTSDTSLDVYGYGIDSGKLKKGKLNTKSTGVLRTTRLQIVKQSKNGDVFFASQSKGHGICAGDSGGPAFLGNSNVIIGITSRAITDDPSKPELADNDVCNYESVFTNVLSYKTWIINSVQWLRNSEKKSLHKL